ncbi:tyrosine-type recombinase/integrase [Yersinia pekkanenii]|uniref:Integrase family protein n=1 Tax=Yersinia pekkanenii TaxID=1288385 RepID=A0A0T9QP89_9GAMM|nr:site-specific integrase [Yersinia pekkanenii]CNI21574.1 integrase family protein [Yersinia pekkanenii]CRY66285.1 integrase family protein [Yersinia pekkanenii]
MASSINRLTDKKLKALSAASNDKEHTLSDGGGLMIRVSKNGAISWFYQYRLDGRGSSINRPNLGRYPDISLSKARELRDQCRKWLAEGRDPQRMLKLDRESTLKPVTVKDALEYWLTEYVDGNLVNATRYRERFDIHVYPYIGEMALADCETHYWLKCLARTKKKAPSVAGMILQMSQQAFKFCRIRRYAICHELDGLTMQDIGVKINKRKRVLSNKELTDLLVAIKSDFFSPFYQNMFYLLTVFGSRTVEVRLSECSEWDLKDKIWTVPEAHSKTSEKIIRPIPESIYPLIKRLTKENKKSGYLLGELKENTAVSSTGGRICERLGHSERWRLHDLRRTFSTGMNDLGIPPHIVELLLGHSLGGVMAVYNRSQYLPEKLDALNKWIERLDVLAGNHKNVVILKVGEK